MAFMQIDMYSKMLTRQTEVAVIIPERNAGSGPFPVVWLLHGAFDNSSGWWRNTAVEHYAEQYGLAVVMPSADVSFYANGPLGRYFDLVTQELPEVLGSMLPLSRDPAQQVVAGLSMGGHGACKLSLTRPDLYAGMAILSAGDFLDLGNPPPGSFLEDIHLKLFGTAVAEELRGTEHDMIHLADEAAKRGGPLPKLYMTCGTEDTAYDSAYKTFRHLTEKTGVVGEWHSLPGEHDWAFWGKVLPDVMRWCASVVRPSES